MTSTPPPDRRGAGETREPIATGDSGRRWSPWYEHAINEPGPIIIFDADWVLCSGMVAFVLAHERDRALRFAGAWSDEGSALAQRHGFSQADLNDTFLVVTAEGALKRSDAGIEILRHLVAPWRWLIVLAAVPRPLRDAVYDIVARRRYRWFGRRENCTVVPTSERHRMIGVVGPPPARP